MNITFFVGNGFDINLGLKTRYSDFYPYFIEHASKENMIRDWLIADEMNWSDLELELGKKLNLITKDVKERFIDDLLELDDLLLDYLELEQNKIDIKGKEELVANEFHKSFKSIIKGLSEEEVDSIISTKNIYASEDNKYCFITFNYTHVLKLLFESAKTKKGIIESRRMASGGIKQDSFGIVYHIHGTINEGMILGVNDASQISNKELVNDKEFLDSFVKVNINATTGQRRMKHAEEIIKASRIICVFGMSIGDTDKLWWERIVKWLRENQNNKFLIFYRTNEEERVRLRRKNPIAVNRLTNEIKSNFLSKCGVRNDDKDYEMIANRIFVSYDTEMKIFDFESCGILQTEKE